MKHLIYPFLIFVFFVCSCGKNDKKITDILGKKDSSVTKSDSIKQKDTTGKIKYTLKDFYSENPLLAKKTDEIFNSLSDEERAGQMIITMAGGLGKPDASVKALIKKKRIGGALILEGSKGELANLIKTLSDYAKESKSLPLIFSADGEPTLINSKLKGSPKVPSASGIKTPQDSKNIAAKISEFLKSQGFNQNYAPVCDYAQNREIIGNRSYGNNKDSVIMLSAAFIRSTQDSGIVATIKHFPGHGTVKGDSHEKLVYTNGNPREIEVFRELIKSSGVISVMVGHIAIGGKSEYKTDTAASLSRKIVTGLLKGELGFKGIVITDGLNMGAVSKLDSPAFRASLAGCDLLLAPLDENKLFNRIVEEMGKNKDYKLQVYESVRKIIRLKICLGLI
jgi:beta-N-acetylhexosaminidase